MDVLEIPTTKIEVGHIIAEPRSMNKDFGRGWKLTPVREVVVRDPAKGVTTCSSRGVHVNSDLCYPNTGTVLIKDQRNDA